MGARFRERVRQRVRFRANSRAVSNGWHGERGVVFVFYVINMLCVHSPLCTAKVQGWTRPGLLAQRSCSPVLLV